MGSAHRCRSCPPGGRPDDGFMLVAYQIALVAILTVIVIDNRYRLSRTAIVTSLAVDLGAGQRAVPSRRPRRGAR